MVTKMKRKTRLAVIILSSLIFALLATVGGLHIYYGSVSEYDFDRHGSLDSIHFLNTGSSDCIIISSCGEYALIDCGNGADRIKDGEIRASRVLMPYLRELVGEEVSFKFAIATHSHKDHLSGFLDLIENDGVKIEKFFIKEPVMGGVRSLYEDTLEKMSEEGIPISTEVEGLELSVGNFELEIVNGEFQERTEYGDNDNSLGIIVKHRFTKTFLAGDITNKSGDEERLAPTVGNIDLLKVAHHGYGGSTVKSFLAEADPELAVITNFEPPNDTVLARLEKYCKGDILSTGESNGVVAVYGMYIKIYKNSCSFEVNE